MSFLKPRVKLNNMKTKKELLLALKFIEDHNNLCFDEALKLLHFMEVSKKQKEKYYIFIMDYVNEFYANNLKIYGHI